MSYQFPNAPLPQRKRHTGRNILIGLGAFVVLIVALAAIGAATGGGKTTPPGKAATYKTPSLATAPQPAPLPTASPAGTYTGSCNYNLNDNINDYPNNVGTLTGEVDLTNTGNVGTVDKVRITWPQEGYGPVVMRKTVRNAAGGTLAVSFHKIASQTVISNLQAWQNGHNYDDGCTYRVVMVNTFGSISG